MQIYASLVIPVQTGIDLYLGIQGRFPP